MNSTAAPQAVKAMQAQLVVPRAVSHGRHAHHAQVGQLFAEGVFSKAFTVLA
jgi:hypothetical protein